jgi:hypothetical protein
VNYFRLNIAEYFTPITVKISGSELALARKRGAEHTLIDFIGEIEGNLKPGECDCQVTVLNPTGRKAAFWQAPILLIP